MTIKRWEEAWEANDIDFHQLAVNPLMQSYWPRLALADDAHVFVPLCGKSQDMAWLLSQNFRVTGVEISPVAVAAFFSENRLTPTLSRHGKLTRWHCGKVEIFCGDFFALRRLDLSDVVAVYDRGALLALGAVMRRRYVRHLTEIMPPPGTVLLLTTEYPDAGTPDLPFAVAEEIQSLYQAAFRIELLHGEYGFETHPGHGRTTSARTEEKVYLMRALPR